MNEPAIDLTGKLIIKVALGDDIRRILITNEDITYDELVLMMQRVYRGKLSSNDDIVIKYKDEDNDLITIFDSSDLTFAIQCSRILKITLFVNNKPEPLQTDEIKMIKGELKHIRDRCNKLLDQLDDRVPSNTPSRHQADSSTGKGAPAQSSESPKRPSPSPRVAPPTSVAGSKEFDPLSTQRSVEEQQNKVMSSFGISGNQERPGTPDSVSSVGSSSSARQPVPPGQPAQQPTPVSQTSIPAQPAPHPGYAQSGQKAQPWQNQSPQAPSAVTGASPYQNQEWSPAVMRSQDFHLDTTKRLYSTARDQHSRMESYNSYRSSLMQAHPYTGHEGHGDYTSSYPANSSQGMPGYTGTYGTSQPQSFPSSTPQASQPGYSAPFSQPGGQSQAQMYSSQPQSMPYSPQQVPASQQAPTGQPGPAGPQQQPGYGGAYPQQQQQPPVQGQPGPGNPYARQGPGYGTGYPRPAGNYPQGYQ